MTSRCFWVSMAIVSAFSCCNRTTPPPTPSDYKYEYFPLKTGSYRVYDVRESNYDPPDTSAPVITYYYQLKEKVESSFLDAQGRKSFRVERYKRTNDSMAWELATPDYVYYATLTKSSAERVEDNLRFIKLIFPPFKNKTWKGNAYISSEDESLSWYIGWDYEYTDIDVPVQFGSFYFDSTATVVGINDTTDNLVEARYSLEQYAMNVGLIYRKIFHLRLDTSNIPVPLPHWEQRANKGFLLEMTLKSYGNE